MWLVKIFKAGAQTHDGKASEKCRATRIRALNQTDILVSHSAEL